MSSGPNTVELQVGAGLLREAARTESGYRVFSPQSVEQLNFIRKAQELGFSLGEIRELLILRDRSTGACSHVKTLVEDKLASLRRKLRELEVMEKDLKGVLAECKRQLTRRHPGGGGQCPVLLKLGRRAVDARRCSGTLENSP